MERPFEVFGPYVLDRHKGVFDPEWQKKGWSGVDSDVGANLSKAIGVYVFSLRNKKNYKPIYVGVTTKQIFRKEVFSSKNQLMISRLNNAKAKAKGTLCLHLLAKYQKVNSGFAKPNRDWLKSLEVLMIFLCRRKNPALLNKKHTVWLDGIGISGVTAHQKLVGKPAHAVSTFKNVMRW